MIVIIDYGMGNLKSIHNRLRRMEIDAVISSRKADILAADKLILPGVGAFGAAMRNLDERNLTAILYEKVINQETPILGICLGMQLFTEYSEEGEVDGLGWIKGKTVKFALNGNSRLRIPHMGWNTLQAKQRADYLHALPNDATFYFVHSYHVICENSDRVVAQTAYGYEFTSVIQQEHILGVQFHPEKSHEEGGALLKYFARQF